MQEIAIFAHADFCNCLLQRYFSWREVQLLRSCPIICSALCLRARQTEHHICLFMDMLTESY